MVLVEVVEGKGFVNSPTGSGGVRGACGGRRVLGLLVGVMRSGCCALRRLEGTEVDTNCQSVGVLERGLSGVTGAAVAMGVSDLATGSSTPITRIAGLGVRSFGSTNVYGSSGGRRVPGLLMVVRSGCCPLFRLGGVGVDPCCQWVGGLRRRESEESRVAGVTGAAAAGLRVGGLVGESSTPIVGVTKPGIRSPLTKRDGVRLRGRGCPPLPGTENRTMGGWGGRGCSGGSGGSGTDGGGDGVSGRPRKRGHDPGGEPVLTLVVSLKVVTRLPQPAGKIVGSLRLPGGLASRIPSPPSVDPSPSPSAPAEPGRNSG